MFLRRLAQQLIEDKDSDENLRSAAWKRADSVCSPSCQNGGKCTAPNTCTCVNGWTGATCEA
ncbi:unnamed protein product, partial [Adineta steineri]